MTDSNTSDTQLSSDQAKENVVNPTPASSETNLRLVCQPGDPECFKRWIQTFSDCE